MPRYGGATKREAPMSFLDKFRNRFMMSRGHAKQEIGRAADDPYLEAEGQRERVSGSARQVGEQVKDAGKNIKDAFER
jgi:uncharacterized protein YjbJ (UPF0337 family)